MKKDIELLESQKGKDLKKCEAKNQERIAELERELGEKSIQFESCFDELQKNSEEKIVSLRNFYEAEKSKAEQRF